MARPRKTRKLGRLPKAVFYLPMDKSFGELAPCEVAIEDFEIMRLVDGHGYHLDEAAGEVGVSRSTAGRMLERARRAIALAIEAHAPLYLDASEHLELDGESGAASQGAAMPGEGLLALAVLEPDARGEVSRLFGRAPYFLLIDEKKACSECIENSGKKLSRGAAKKAVELLAARGARRVVAGRYGPESLRYLSEAGIEPLLATGLSVANAIELYSSYEWK